MIVNGYFGKGTEDVFRASPTMSVVHVKAAFQPSTDEDSDDGEECNFSGVSAA